MFLLFSQLKKRFINTNRQTGFTMLFAVLVSSLLLSIGISIFNLTIKELSLSAAGRESQFAFYAADTGADCALYWDLKGSVDGSTFSFATPEDQDQRDPISCGATNSVALSQTGDASAITTTFSFKPVSDSSSSACVQVSVKKTDVGATIIESRGYNMGYNESVTPPNCLSQSPLKVERGVRFTY